MKTQDVIDMALASGMYQDGEMFFSPATGDADVHIADLEYFAELVAAAEREACAKLCDDVGHTHDVPQGSELAFDLAAAIRGRQE